MSIYVCKCGKVGEIERLERLECPGCGRPVTEAQYRDPGEGPLTRLGNGNHRKSDLEGAITHRREGQK